MTRWLGIGLCLILIGSSVTARAQSEAPARDASRHFQRGVDLYNEGDVRGALVEFKRAYTLLPRATVLYNIGQAEYQLQEYAAALRTLERFLADTGPNAAHRSDVQQTIDVLRGRVGHVALRTDRAECEVLVDDLPAGTTPLAEPILVSIGRRKVAISCAGAQRIARDVEVAAGETIALDLKIDGPVAAVAEAGRSPAAATERPRGRRGTAAWVATGLLTAATLAVYSGALVHSRQLDRLRRTYPVTTRELDAKARLTYRLALTGDVLAASAVVAAGVASYLRWGTGTGRTEVSFAPNGVFLHRSF